MSNLTDQEWEIVPTKEVPAPGGGTMVVNAEPVDPWAETVPDLGLGAPAESVPVTKTPRQSRRVPTVPKTAKHAARPAAKPAATRTLKVVPSSADPTSAPEAAAPTEATAKRRGRKPAAEKPQPEPT